MTPWALSLGLCMVILGLPCGWGLTTPPRDHVKIFSLQRPDDDPMQEIPELRSAWVYGLSWRFKWRTIEPQHGQYRWDLLDNALAVTGRAGKKAMLRITAGINSPDWVYQAGAQAFVFRNTDLAHPENYPASLHMPIPWDAAYLAKWEEFIHAFGKRYNNHPHIYSIQMTGGGHIGEMNLPKAHAKWAQIGYTDAKLIAAWKRIIDAYQGAFPDTPTNLDLNEPLGKRSNVLEPVVSYVLTTYPGKVYLQYNGLKADFPRDHRIRRLIQEASNKTVVGYQMVGGKGFLERQAGDRLTAFRHAVEDGISYLEIYASDIRDPRQRGALQFLTTRIEGR